MPKKYESFKESADAVNNSKKPASFFESFGSLRNCHIWMNLTEMRFFFSNVYVI